MNVTVLLEWTYSPPDFFDESIEIVQHDYSLTIIKGKAEAKIDSSVFDADPSVRQELHNELYYRFFAMQLLKYKPFALSSSSMVRIHPDGSKDIFLSGTSSAISMTGTVDIRLIDKNGNIVVDTKQERIEKTMYLTGLLSLHGEDETLRKMMGSFNTAMRDPDNELVHLYEIHDALKTRFGAVDKARSKLNLSIVDIRRFGKICNVLPLRQGRHRGNATGELRSATQEELTEARNIAGTMIEAYLHFLH